MNCFICSAPFQQAASIIRHLKKIHGTPSQFTFKCVQCQPSLIFQNVYSYKRHLKNKHEVCEETNHEQSAEQNVRNDNNDSNPEYVVNSNVVHAENDDNLVEIDDKSGDNQSDEIDRIRKSLFESTLGLHNNSRTTRKEVISIQNDVTCKVVQPILNIISEATIPYLRDETRKKDVQLLVEQLKQPFPFISSEHRLFKQLKSNDLLKLPTMYTINEELVEMVLHGEPTVDLQHVRGCLMPIEFQMKKYFESGSIFHETMENMSKIEQSKSITNFINGSLWRQIKDVRRNEILIPYFVYSDEVEICDPLGSNAGTHKICGFYYNFPTIPSHHLPR